MGAEWSPLPRPQLASATEVLHGEHMALARELLVQMRVPGGAVFCWLSNVVSSSRRACRARLLGVGQARQVKEMHEARQVQEMHEARQVLKEGVAEELQVCFELPSQHVIASVPRLAKRG